MLHTKAYCASRQWIINLTVWGLYGGTVHSHISIGRLVFVSLAGLIQGEEACMFPQLHSLSTETRGSHEQWKLQWVLAASALRSWEKGGRDVFNGEERGNERDYTIAVATMWLEELNPQQKCATEGFFLFSFICPALIAHLFTSSEQSSFLGFECLMTSVFRSIFV